MPIWKIGVWVSCVVLLTGCGNTTLPREGEPTPHSEEFGHLPDITFLSHDLFTQSTHLNATWNGVSLIQEDASSETLSMRCRPGTDPAATTLRFLLPLHRYNFSGGVRLSPENLYPVNLQISVATSSDSPQEPLIDAILQPGQLLTFDEAIENTSSNSSLIIRCGLPQQAPDNTHANLTFSHLALEGWYE